jgi:hypothetical protein
MQNSKRRIHLFVPARSVSLHFVATAVVSRREISRGRLPSFDLVDAKRLDLARLFVFMPICRTKRPDLTRFEDLLRRPRNPITRRGNRVDIANQIEIASPKAGKSGLCSSLLGSFAAVFISCCSVCGLICYFFLRVLQADISEI